ncbi:MAG: hypothetical protein KGM99_15770, partial [Burkholderiales bacterium]|nr:hypothetical protein [Burkholderiales bacterium]
MQQKSIKKMQLFYWSLQLFCVAAGVAQLFIQPTQENILSTVWCASASTAMVQYLSRSDCVKDHPFSSLALLGFNITSLLTSLVSMSLYGQPLVNGLRAPEITFPALSILHFVAIGTHWVYRNFTPFSGAPQKIASTFFRPLGLFATPHISAIWMMGALGALSMVLGNAETGDVGGKTIQALSFLCWMPFLIPFYQAREEKNYCNMKKQAFFIACFVLLMILIGLARNMRQIMLIGPLQLLFAYYILLSNRGDLATKRSIRRFVLVLVTGALSIYLAADFATAMVVARAKRDKATYQEMIETTFTVLTKERYRLQQYRDSTDIQASTSFYDEKYIPNPILARLSETKFHDNMFYFGSRFSERNTEALIESFKNKTLSILPENIIKIFDREYRKNDYFYSMGDYYLYLIAGEERLGSFVTGSIWADFYTLFGWAFFAVTAPYMLIMYIALDSLSMREREIGVSAVGICT